MATSISLGNYIITENLDKSHEVINAKNLIVFPGVKVRFSHVTLSVENNLVTLGDFTAISCTIKSGLIHRGGPRTIDELDGMIGFSERQRAVLIEKLKNYTGESVFKIS